MNNQKNIVIGGLLAIVFIMAVGFAAFSSNLVINGNATVGGTTGDAGIGTDYAWNVGFDTGVTTGTATGSATCGDVSYDAETTVNGLAQKATFAETTLSAPGDKCTYKLKIKNLGTIDASMAAPTINSTVTDSSTQAACTTSDLSCTYAAGTGKETITWTTTGVQTAAGAAQGTIAAKTGEGYVTVTVEFIKDANDVTSVTGKVVPFDVTLVASGTAS